MPHTYTINFIHCVFSTKERAPTIAVEKREQLWAYVAGISKNIGVELAAIGGMSDHIHLLIALPSDKKLSEVVPDLKSNSSRWMREASAEFSWQEGYGAFSVSPSQIPVVKEYIRNQAQHHEKRKFEDEFVAMLNKSGVSYDGKYVFG